MFQPNSFSLKRLIGTGAEPVSLAEVKLHCRVEIAEDDTLLASYIVAARMRAEMLTGLSLVASQWQLTLDRFPLFGAEQRVRIPRAPLLSVDTIQYQDLADVEQTLSPDAYEWAGDVIVPVFLQRWPSTRPGVGKVKINFNAGYESDAVPATVKQALLLMVSSWYENREDIIISTGQAQTLPRAAEHLLELHRTSHVGYEVAA